MKYIKQFEYVIDNEVLKNLRDSGVSVLYHAIKSDRAITALNENKLGGYSIQRTWDGGKRLKDDHPEYDNSNYLRGLSTSRDIEYCAKWNDVIFVFDKEKIKNKYKILPYNWGYSIGRGYNQGINAKREREEFIITGFNKGFKSDDRNQKFFKMYSNPNGYIEPLDKYLIGFFISNYVGEYMNADIKQQLQSHPKYLGFYIEERSKNKNLSIKDNVKNAFNKKFENQEVYEDKPSLGDYVKVYVDSIDHKTSEFFKTAIGKIKKISDDDDNISYPYEVEFETAVPSTGNTIMDFSIDEIIEFAPTKKMFDVKKSANKYNL